MDFQHVSGDLTVAVALGFESGVEIEVSDSVAFISHTRLAATPDTQRLAVIATHASPVADTSVIENRPITSGLVDQFEGVLVVPLAGLCPVHHRLCRPSHIV